MARVTFNGPPGSVWHNDTGKVQFQLLVQWHNTCGVCAQYDHAIGPWWPIPFHPGCRCRQSLLEVGATADPFVDFRAEIQRLDRVQQSRVIGRSNLVLVEHGVVTWDDVVTTGRVRSLREVVSRNKLTVARMTRAGVVRRLAEEAYQAVHTPAHEIADSARREAIQRLRALGVGTSAIRQRVGVGLAGRVTIGAGPSGPSRPATPPPTPPKPPPPPPVPTPTTSHQPPATTPPPKYGPSRARVVIDPAHAPAVRRAMTGVFGKALAHAELASIGGAPHDASVTVRVDEDDPTALQVLWELAPDPDDPGPSGAVRTFHRDETGVWVHNDALKLQPAHQGRGLAREIFGRQVEQLTALGVARIETLAFRRDPKWFGYHVWPKFGYNGAIPESVRARLPEALADAQTVADLYRTEEGVAWWKVHGTSFDATFDLTAGSDSLATWEAYRRQKEAEEAARFELHPTPNPARPQPAP